MGQTIVLLCNICVNANKRDTLVQVLAITDSEDKFKVPDSGATFETLETP